MRQTQKINRFHPKKNDLLYYETGLIISLLIMIGIFKLDFQKLSPKKLVINLSEDEILTVYDIPRTKFASAVPTLPSLSVVNPPADLPKPIDIPAATLTKKLPEVNLEFDTFNQPVDFSAVQKELSQKIIKEQTYHVAEEWPELLGGFSSLQRRINYPRQAIRDGIEGRVIIQFTIDKTGEVTEPLLIKGIRDDCDQEAMKALSSSRFSPARLAGRPIRIRYMIYILFRIEPPF